MHPTCPAVAPQLGVSWHIARQCAQPAKIIDQLWNQATFIRSLATPLLMRWTSLLGLRYTVWWSMRLWVYQLVIRICLQVTFLMYRSFLSASTGCDSQH